MIKILVVAAHFYPHVGGVERYVEELYGRLVKAGNYEVHILTVANEGERYELYKGLHVHRVRSAFSIGSIFVVPVLGEWRRVIKGLLKDGGFKYVNTHTRFFATSYLAARTARAFGIDHIHTEHGASPVVHASIVIRLGSKAFDLLFGRYVMKKAKRVVAISQAGVGFCRSMGARDVVYVPNGVDDIFWQPTRPGKSGADVIRLTYVGRMVEAKGVHYLLEAFRMLPDSWELTLVGAGELLEEVRTACRGERISFTGNLDREAVKKQLHSTDVFVNPSLNEGLPTVVLEALSAGVPTVATDVGGTKEILAHVPEFSRLVAPADSRALAEALQDLAGNLAEGDEAELHVRIAKEYGWDAVAIRIETVFS